MVIRRVTVSEAAIAFRRSRLQGFLASFSITDLWNEERQITRSGRLKVSTQDAIIEDPAARRALAAFEPPARDDESGDAEEARYSDQCFNSPSPMVVVALPKLRRVSFSRAQIR